MIYLTSDSHYSHANIIKYCNRPYENTYFMNKDLIARYNERVKPGDLVFHLGDFAFCKGQKLYDIVQSLNVVPIMIIGNHDSTSKLKEAGIQHIYHEAYITYAGRVFHLNHYPTTVDYRSGVVKRPKDRIRTDIQLHGHQHQPKAKRVTAKNTLDVGCDGNDYYPYSIDEVLEILS